MEGHREKGHKASKIGKERDHIFCLLRIRCVVCKKILSYILCVVLKINYLELN